MPAYSPVPEYTRHLEGGGGPAGRLTPDEDNDLVLSMLSRRDSSSSSMNVNRNGNGNDEGLNHSLNMVEPSAVPPYWSFSTTRAPLVQEGSAPSLLLPRAFTSASSSSTMPSTSTSTSNNWSSTSSPSGIDEDAVVLPSVSAFISAQSPPLRPRSPPFGNSSSDLHQNGFNAAGQVRRNDADIDNEDEDEDDASKGPASGPNALPVSPPRRIRRLPNVLQLLDGSAQLEENCEAGCPAERCTCSRRTSPAPGVGISPTASSLLASSSGSSSKGKRKRDTSYIRKSSYLQPGVVFTGSQSFRTFASHNPHRNPGSSYAAYLAATDYHRRNAINNYHAMLATQPAEGTYGDTTNTSRSPARHVIATALDHLGIFGRRSDTGNDNIPRLSVPSPFGTQAPESTWSAIEGSAIDPSMQDLLYTNPSYGYTSGDSIARASSTEEWEVQVSISSVDYVRGKVTGIMTALNVPNSSCLPSTPSSVGPASASLANGIDSSNTVTTSFEGEIIDLRNNGLWTRSTPNGHRQPEGVWSESSYTAPSDSHDDQMDEDDDDAASIYVGGSHSSCTGGSWLASNQTVDKSTDLEYWAKLDAFASYGPLAEKEICKIAREGKWPEEKIGPITGDALALASAHSAAARERDRNTFGHPQVQRQNHHQHHRHAQVKRPSPQDYILMRWKERDFIDCDARSSGLTISGFYYLCLNRKSGALSGFYFDPLSTPHQKLELEVAQTRCQPQPGQASSAQQQEGGIWFGTYSVL